MTKDNASGAGMAADKNNGIGGIIKAMRRQCGMTQKQLGELVGLERTSITNIERGNQVLSVTTINAIANALGCDVKVRFIRRQPAKPAVDPVIEAAAKAMNAAIEDGLRAQDIEENWA